MLLHAADVVMALFKCSTGVEPASQLTSKNHNTAPAILHITTQNIPNKRRAQPLHKPKSERKHWTRKKLINPSLMLPWMRSVAHVRNPNKDNRGVMKRRLVWRRELVLSEGKQCKPYAFSATLRKNRTNEEKHQLSTPWWSNLIRGKPHPALKANVE